MHLCLILPEPRNEMFVRKKVPGRGYTNLLKENTVSTMNLLTHSNVESYKSRTQREFLYLKINLTHYRHFGAYFEDLLNCCIYM